MESMNGGSVVKYNQTTSARGLVIGDAVNEGDVLKVRVNKKKDYLVFGLFGSTSTMHSEVEYLPYSYCWILEQYGIYPFAAGESQPMIMGVVNSSQVILLKRVNGELHFNLADGTVITMSIPEGVFYFFVSLPSLNDEVELLSATPAEAASF